MHHIFQKARAHIFCQALLCQTLLGLAGVSTLSAREIFVSPNGSNSTGNGSLASPYQSLLHVLEPANSIVEAGDVITLRGTPSGTVYAANEYRVGNSALPNHGARWHLFAD
jgi:hypothetical protein